ncbi:uncharacterized protein A4U43_C03F3020 [Asparagus officinalis]|uniref:Uncharacterized protein n=1 Tax=Asparagus officinalis TaxID=4686 RepID=A0A5P1F7N0_ASPOF|nr:uncharacterized protein A4U43_C03F3020 [Asparagus officinalis]
MAKMEAENFVNLLRTKELELDACRKEVEMLKLEIGHLNNRITESVEEAECRRAYNSATEAYTSSFDRTKPVEEFLNLSGTVTGKIVAMKSIAAYRSGLDINTNVSKKADEEGLLEDLHGTCKERLYERPDW